MTTLCLLVPVIAPSNQVSSHDQNTNSLLPTTSAPTATPSREGGDGRVVFNSEGGISLLQIVLLLLVLLQLLQLRCLLLRLVLENKELRQLVQRQQQARRELLLEALTDEVPALSSPLLLFLTPPP
eukprot:CAMPEP_0173128650 /NCGR_PEP_ID=MMETSP1102-20130122/58673_1 /TAXON_ID=49646 /ORGANISM="Geminigera sp., Strain Caron Lab Isolate" /LENGTH=125 /DNA_ID=CAMNT_0014038819 /DNA_START=253 /DNA_END=627 /DNA_ORIENTATION=+